MLVFLGSIFVSLFFQFATDSFCKTRCSHSELLLACDVFVSLGPCPFSLLLASS